MEENDQEIVYLDEEELRRQIFEGFQKLEEMKINGKEEEKKEAKEISAIGSEVKEKLEETIREEIIRRLKKLKQLRKSKAFRIIDEKEN